MKKNRISSFLTLTAGTALCLTLAACSSYGPKSMAKDQLDYGTSIGNNWKNQMLSNIVKLRFVDMPVFVDVGQIVAGYTLETSVNGAVGFGNSFTGGDSQGLGASSKFTDRPTVTYTPKTGDAYLRSLLEPVKPRSLLSLIQAGYNSELLFTWAVESINGVQNYSASSQEARAADPKFREFVTLMRELQKRGAVGFELEKDSDDKTDIILKLKKKGLDEATLQKLRRVGELLGLDESQPHYRVIYAPFRSDPDTLTLQTRSVIQMLVAMAGFVDVPSEVASHASPGYVLPSGVSSPFRVHSGPDRPKQSFARIRYQNHWYWIENDDLRSKQVFTLMLFLTTMTNTTAAKNAPVLTIPTG
jgi:hypothetical protein